MGKAPLPIPRTFHLLSLQRRVRIGETIQAHSGRRKFRAMLWGASHIFPAPHRLGNWSADILVRFLPLVNPKADRNVGAPEKCEMRTWGSAPAILDRWFRVERIHPPWIEPVKSSAGRSRDTRHEAEPPARFDPCQFILWRNGFEWAERKEPRNERIRFGEFSLQKAGFSRMCGGRVLTPLRK